MTKNKPENIDHNTQQRILNVALVEFLEKGFQKASLRHIVSEAGVTTGSFYWYYKSKEELFAALVAEHYDYILGLYDEAIKTFWDLSEEEQLLRMGEIGNECMMLMIDYMFAHKDAFQLLLGGAAEGTKYNNMIHHLTECEIEATHQLIEQHGQNEAERVEPELEHILISGMFAAMAELILHDVPIEKAKRFALQLHAFYTAGWKELMDI